VSQVRSSGRVTTEESQLDEEWKSYHKTRHGRVSKKQSDDIRNGNRR
jgi:hypothetical protein